MNIFPWLLINAAHINSGKILNDSILPSDRQIRVHLCWWLCNCYIYKGFATTPSRLWLFQSCIYRQPKCLKVSRSQNKIVEPKLLPKKWMNEFVFLSWQSKNIWNLKSKFQFQVFSVCQDRKSNLSQLNNFVLRTTDL